jgi:hypothetical protein
MTVDLICAQALVWLNVRSPSIGHMVRDLKGIV